MQPDPIMLTSRNARRWRRWRDPAVAAHRQVLRARIVLAAADGASNAGDRQPSGRVRGHGPQVAAHGTRSRAGRADRRCPGPAGRGGSPRCSGRRSRRWPASCRPPRRAVVAWSSAELACEAIEAGVVVDISASTVRRWLAADALKPWQYRSWISHGTRTSPPRPAVVLDLYARIFDGEPLGPDDYVLAPMRRPDPGPLPLPPHPATRAGPADAGGARVRPGRGTWPTWPPRTCTAPRCSAAASRPPASPRSPARRPGHDHRALRQRAAGVLGRRQRLLPPRTGVDRPDEQGLADRDLVHLPVHACWLNQVEIYFSILQRKVVDPQRLLRPGRPRATHHHLPRPLQRTADTIRLALHPQRPHHLLAQRLTPTTPHNPRRTNGEHHLATAMEVGRRKSSTPVLLRVRAHTASEQGVRFWRGNEMVWLSDGIPAEFLRLEA